MNTICTGAQLATLQRIAGQKTSFRVALYNDKEEEAEPEEATSLCISYRDSRSEADAQEAVQAAGLDIYGADYIDNEVMIFSFRQDAPTTAKEAPMQTAKTPQYTRMMTGDCLQEMKRLPDNSVDLIITSPPYADQRKNTYGGIKPGEYVAWFMPRAAEMKRVLKPTGSFILNIKEKVENGERTTYVLELILAMRQAGWLWTEEYIWHKKNAAPGKWPNRFRDGWERLLHFTKEKKFKMNQEAVKIPVGDWSKSRLKKLSENDKHRHNSATKSGIGRNISNWVGKEMVLPDNVLHLAGECSNKGHSAAFPETLPSWFIKLFTDEGDTVLDPFAGSGTTLAAAQKLNRNGIGIEIMPEFITIASKRLEEIKLAQ